MVQLLLHHVVQLLLDRVTQPLSNVHLAITTGSQDNITSCLPIPPYHLYQPPECRIEKLSRMPRGPLKGSMGLHQSRSKVRQPAVMRKRVGEAVQVQRRVSQSRRCLQQAHSDKRKEERRRSSLLNPRERVADTPVKSVKHQKLRQPICPRPRRDESKILLFSQAMFHSERFFRSTGTWMVEDGEGGWRDQDGNPCNPPSQYTGF